MVAMGNIHGLQQSGVSSWKAFSEQSALTQEGNDHLGTRGPNEEEGSVLQMFRMWDHHDWVQRERGKALTVTINDDTLRLSF